jgi:hypothetical protein
MLCSYNPLAESYHETIGLITAQKMALAGTALSVESVLAKVVRILPVTLQEQVSAGLKQPIASEPCK